MPKRKNDELVTRESAIKCLFNERDPILDFQWTRDLLLPGLSTQNVALFLPSSKQFRKSKNVKCSLLKNATILAVARQLPLVYPVRAFVDDNMDLYFMKFVCLRCVPCPTGLRPDSYAKLRRYFKQAMTLEGYVPMVPLPRPTEEDGITPVKDAVISIGPNYKHIKPIMESFDNCAKKWDLTNWKLFDSTVDQAISALVSFCCNTCTYTGRPRLRLRLPAEEDFYTSLDENKNTQCSKNCVKIKQLTDTERRKQFDLWTDQFALPNDTLYQIIDAVKAEGSPSGLPAQEHDSEDQKGSTPPSGDLKQNLRVTHDARGMRVHVNNKPTSGAHTRSVAREKLLDKLDAHFTDKRGLLCVHHRGYPCWYPVRKLFDSGLWTVILLKSYHQHSVPDSCVQQIKEAIDWQNHRTTIRKGSTMEVVNREGIKNAFAAHDPKEFYQFSNQKALKSQSHPLLGRLAAHTSMLLSEEEPVGDNFEPIIRAQHLSLYKPGFRGPKHDDDDGHHTENFIIVQSYGATASFLCLPKGEKDWKRAVHVEVHNGDVFIFDRRLKHQVIVHDKDKYNFRMSISNRGWRSNASNSVRSSWVTKPKMRLPLQGVQFDASTDTSEYDQPAGLLSTSESSSEVEWSRRDQRDKLKRKLIANKDRVPAEHLPAKRTLLPADDRAAQTKRPRSNCDRVHPQRRQNMRISDDDKYARRNARTDSSPNQRKRKTTNDTYRHGIDKTRKRTHRSPRGHRLDGNHRHSRSQHHTHQDRQFKRDAYRHRSHHDQHTKQYAYRSMTDSLPSGLPAQDAKRATMTDTPPSGLPAQEAKRATIPPPAKAPDPTIIAPPHEAADSDSSDFKLSPRSPDYEPDSDDIQDVVLPWSFGMKRSELAHYYATRETDIWKYYRDYRAQPLFDAGYSNYLLTRKHPPMMIVYDYTDFVFCVLNKKKYWKLASKDMRWNIANTSAEGWANKCLDFLRKHINRHTPNDATLAMLGSARSSVLPTELLDVIADLADDAKKLMNFQLEQGDWKTWPVATNEMIQHHEQAMKELAKAYARAIYPKWCWHEDYMLVQLNFLRTAAGHECETSLKPYELARWLNTEGRAGRPIPRWAKWFYTSAEGKVTDYVSYAELPPELWYKLFKRACHKYSGKKQRALKNNTGGILRLFKEEHDKENC